MQLATVPQPKQDPTHVQRYCFVIIHPLVRSCCYGQWQWQVMLPWLNADNILAHQNFDTSCKTLHSSSNIGLCMVCISSARSSIVCTDCRRAGSGQHRRAAQGYSHKPPWLWSPQLRSPRYVAAYSICVDMAYTFPTGCLTLLLLLAKHVLWIACHSDRF